MSEIVRWHFANCDVEKAVETLVKKDDVIVIILSGWLPVVFKIKIWIYETSHYSYNTLMK